MVKVNGKTIKVYNLDTVETLLVRVATELKTIPKYLYFPDGMIDIQRFYTEEDITVTDLLNKIRTNNVLEFSTFIKNLDLENKINQLGLNLYSDIFVPFLVFNNSLIAMDKEGMLGAGFLLIQEELKTENYFDTNAINLEKIWEERVIIKENILKKINQNNADNVKNIKQNSLFEETESIPYTNFELESTKFKIIVDIKNISIIEVFNLIQLNIRVPFASFNGFYKILKDYLPVPEWDIYLENTIILKVYQLINISQNVKSENYTDVVISIDEETNFMVFEMELQVGKQNLSREMFIESIMEIFPSSTDLKIDKVEESTAKGVFYFPKSELNNYILSDLIMNDILFSSMLSIDEHDKATKSKNSLYIHFFNNMIGKISANVTEKISERGDPVLRGKDITDLFKYGSKYIRVKISYSSNQESVLLFQDLFGKILNIYYSKYTQIFEYYKKFIPDFGKEIYRKEIENIPELRLKDIEPELFLPGYTKFCPSPPTIIPDEDVEDEKIKGRQVMTYPKVEDEGILPRNYICTYKDKPYPGLRDNPLSNKDKIPYLPCCYQKDHTKIKGNIYAQYYKGEPLKDKEGKKQQNYIITNKFLPHNFYGFLPDNIKELFDMIDIRDNYNFIRKGVSNTKSSFLECIIAAITTDKDIINATEEQWDKILKQTRKQLANSVSAALCKQEMYDFTTEEIINIIKDTNKYFDPQYFINLLENEFKCNIFIFNRKNMAINAQLKLPRFLKAYYKTKNDYPCIFIYQHMGSPSDKASEPRCELIIRSKDTNIVPRPPDEYTFNQSKKVSKDIMSIFENMRLSYTLTSEIKETIFPINSSNKIEIISQGIDSYGKTRILNVKYLGKLSTILTSPLQPLSYPESNSWEIVRVSQDFAKKLVEELGITLENQDIIEDYAKTFNGKLGNVKVSIPIVDTVPTMIGNNQNKLGINYPENNVSELENYNKYKKLARYILSYVYWLYSKYLFDQNKTISLDTIAEFIDKFTVVIPDFEYGYVSKFFDMKSGVMKDNKIVLKSEESLKRIVYSLKLFSRQRNKLLNYHKNLSIEEYYVDLTDFDQYQFQVIVQGENALEKWINEQKLNYKLYNSIQENMMLKPYFFKNELISDKIYLAQNTTSLQKALNIANVWKDDGYNIGGDPKIDETDNIDQTFLLYSYKNSKDITAYVMHNKGNVTNDTPKLVGYKIGDESFYTVLLDL
jgi:hypothetical protein